MTKSAVGDGAGRALPVFDRRLTGDDYKAIGRIAGVVERTVRRVFDGSGEDSRDRVIAAAIRHVYGDQPDAVFGLVRPDVENQFFDSLVGRLKRRLRLRRMLLTVIRSNDYVERELEDLKFLVGSGVSGVFYVQNPRAESIRYLTEKAGMPIVLVDVDVSSSQTAASHAWLAADAVLTDNREGIAQALGYLVNENGHQVVGFLAGPEATSTAQARLRAFVEVAHEYGLPTDERLILRGDYTFVSGEAAANRLQMLHRSGCDPFPTAIVCSNDLMAAGLIKGLQRAGIEVPGQMSIVGFDHIPMTEWWTPTIASVDQKIGLLADAAVGNMLAKLGGSSLSGQTSEPTKLVTPELKRGESVIHRDRALAFDGHARSKN